MTKKKLSYDLPVELPPGLTPTQVMSLVARASEVTGLTISHIGSYSRKRFPNSVHWHFKRDMNEAGLIDATYWDVRSLLWLMVRYSEPEWVHQTAPQLQAAMVAEAIRVGSQEPA